MTRPMRRFMMNVGFMLVGFLLAGSISVVFALLNDLRTMRHQVDMLERQVNAIDQLVVR